MTGSAPGDITGDGSSDGADWLELAMILSRGGDVPGPEAADLNGDGTVNRLDRIELARTLAG